MKPQTASALAAVVISALLPLPASAQGCLGAPTTTPVLLFAQVAGGKVPTGERLAEIGIGAVTRPASSLPWLRAGGTAGVARFDASTGGKATAFRVEVHAAAERRVGTSDLAPSLCAGARASHGSYGGDPERDHSTGALFVGASFAIPFAERAALIPYASMNVGVFRRSSSGPETLDSTGRDLFGEGGVVLAKGRVRFGIGALFRHFEFDGGRLRPALRLGITV